MFDLIAIIRAPGWRESIPPTSRHLSTIEVHVWHRGRRTACHAVGLHSGRAVPQCSTSTALVCLSCRESSERAFMALSLPLVQRARLRASKRDPAGKIFGTNANASLSVRAGCLHTVTVGLQESYTTARSTCFVHRAVAAKCSFLDARFCVGYCDRTEEGLVRPIERKLGARHRVWPNKIITRLD